MKRILMIAFHYPPLQGGSGIHRTVSFTRYLPEHGWQPIVLTLSEKAYPEAGENRPEAPHGVLVERAFALDAARHLSIRGSHLKWTTLPDRWISWWPAAVARGLRLIRAHRPHAIWSTYPIATAHLIGLTLSRLTGVPWIADFRDPMTDTDPITGQEFPLDPTVRKLNSWIERPTIGRCVRAVFTTPGAARMYAERYPKISESRWSIIPNGFDEEDFAGLGDKASGKDRRQNQVLLVHSGLLYPHARDPRPFLSAVSDLRKVGLVSSSNLKIIFRHSGYESKYRQLLRDMGIEDIASLEAGVPYQQALEEMLDADGLLLFQASNCNSQIPAKLYEYLRVRRPIFALVDPNGDTAEVLKSEGIDTIVPLDSKQEISRGLVDFLARVREERAPVAGDSRVALYSRRHRTEELARLLDASIGD